MLLKTRFYLPPLRANVVRREHLLQALQASSGGSVVLVAAPAGYGKSTLVSQWLHAYPQTFAWLTLGAEHNVIGVFWQYLLAALQQMAPELGRDAERDLLASTTPDYQALLVSLLNDLDQLSINNRTRDPITLVLDDFHLLHNPRLLQLINLFLDHLPAGIRVVITARSEPELQLARRRASGQLLQLGIAELRFSPAEARLFFEILMSGENADNSEALCARTEGWIAGLQLAALSLQRGHADARALLQNDELDRHIADYLLEEVFATLSGTLQQFLLNTALVGRFCAGLANALDERQDSLTILLEVESLNLFLVPLDNHRTWYRYHDLFRQFLLQRLTRQHGWSADGLVARALGWLEANGYWDEAIELCLEWQQWSAALRLLQHESVQLLAQAEQGRWQQWLQQIPVAELVQVPGLKPEYREINEPETTAWPDQVEPLTQQEKKVLELIGQGLPNKTIARQLQISLNTLKVHIRNLYGKMGVENRTQVLLKLHEEGRH